MIYNLGSYVVTKYLLDETAFVRRDYVIIVTIAVGAIHTAVHSLDEHLVPVGVLMGIRLHVITPHL